MRSSARTAWVIVIGGFLAGIAVFVGAVAVSSLLVDQADRAVVERTE